MRFLYPFSIVSVLALGLPACSSASGVSEDVRASEDGKETSEALTPDTQTPVNCGGTVVSPCPLPNTGRTGTWPAAPLFPPLGTVVCNGCSFSTGKDLKAAYQLPTTQDAAGLSAPDAAYVNTLPTWGSSNGLRQKHADMATVAKPMVDPPAVARPAQKEIQRALDSAYNVMVPLAALAGSTISKPTVTASAWYKPFPSIAAKNIVEKVKPAAGYVDPLPLQEIRSRGARSYCAMREAAIQANGSALNLGSGSSGEAIFWKFGQVNASLRLLAPKKSIDSNVAEAFAIPMTLGSRLSPIQGPLMPDFGELTHNVVWISGDAELLSNEKPKWNGFSTTYQERDRNLYHGDVMTGETIRGNLNIPKVLLADFGGLVKLLAGGSISVVTGELVENNPWAKSAVLSPSVLQGNQWPTARPGTADAVLLSASPLASDGPVTVQSNSLYPAVFNQVTAGWVSPLKGPLLVRTQNDDDRTAVVRDSAQENLTVSANFGFSLGPISAGITALSKITVTSEQNIILSEHLSMVDATKTLPIPGLRFGMQSNFVAIPELHSSVEVEPLNVGLNFNMHLSLGFGSIDVDWSDQFLSLGKAKPASFNYPEMKLSDEQWRLRAGEFFESAFVAPDAKRPSTASHLPGGGNFPTFPGTVQECLASEKVIAPPAASQPGGTTPGKFEGAVCSMGIRAGRVQGNPMPDDICSNPSAKSQFAYSVECRENSECEELHLCVMESLDFLCGGPNQDNNYQAYQGEMVLARKLTSVSEQTRVGELIQRCSTAYVAKEQDPVEATFWAKIFASNFISPAVACKFDGTLIQE